MNFIIKLYLIDLSFLSLLYSFLNHSPPVEHLNDSQLLITALANSLNCIETALGFKYIPRTKETHTTQNSKGKYCL